MSAKLGRDGALNFLLMNMSDIKSQIDCPDKYGNTALMLAIRNLKEGPKVIQILIEAGANSHYQYSLRVF